MTFNPDEVVALGAAVQARCAGRSRGRRYGHDRCIPAYVGVEIAKQFGSQRTFGYFEPIIHRNTTIPVSRESTSYTLEPNQFTVKLKVFPR